MNVPFDTDVILDVLLEREPFVNPTVKRFALVDNRRLEGSACATTVTTVFYIACKDFGLRRARDQVRGLLSLFKVASVDGAVLASALDLDFSDWEDAVLHEAARAIGAKAIVTRDRRGFARSTIPVLDPQELLAVVASSL